MDAVSMTDISKGDLRKAKRFKLKESSDINENDLLTNVPIFSLLTTLQAELSVLNE